jgi:His-Xaa-Ser system radical SAM maturase HxsB
VPRGTVSRIVNKEVKEDEDLYKDLQASFIISDSPVPRLLDNLSVRLATRKSFLDNYTALHIFVMTLRCNQNCVYCQASSRVCDKKGFDMSEEDLFKSIDLMYKSPSPHVTMEFQGGEPTLVSDLIMKGILYSEEKKLLTEKKVTYVICTNSVNVPEKLLEFCSNYNVVFSTSLDGPEWLHNTNRGKTDSYEKVIAGIKRVREAIGDYKVSALMTTSELSLNYPKEIVDAYRANGFNSMFIRSLNPYGLAKDNDDWPLYFDRFIDFYKEDLEYIIEINKSGETFIEELTTMILKKILTPFPIGFVDLQTPSGIVNGVIVYNYDGYVYASDESRMLAENGDYTFRLGKITDDYNDVFYGKRVQELSRVWATEYIAGCSDCAYQSICGADPVRNYSTQGDEYGYRPGSTLCKKNKAIIEHVFTLLDTRKEELMPIFQRWITGVE